jgi:hypothetical protein
LESRVKREREYETDELDPTRASSE